MKKLIPLLLLFGCSQDENPCDCNKITDIVTFQVQRSNGVHFESTITTMNVCDSNQTQLTHHRTKSQWKIPKLGSCFKK